MAANMRTILAFVAAFKFALLAADIEWDFETSACPPGRFFSTVGSFNVTAKNFRPLFREHKRLLIAVSSSACRECCPFENVLFALKGLFGTEPRAENVPEVKIGRVDIVNEPWFQAEFPSAVLPDLHYFRNQTPFSLPEKSQPELIFEQIARIERPFVKIGSVEELFDFLDPRQARLNFKYKRLLCVLPEQKLLGQFEEVAKSTYWRLDIKYGLVDQASLVKEIEALAYKLTKSSETANDKRLVLRLESFGISSLEPDSAVLISYKGLFKPEHASNIYQGKSDSDFIEWFIDNSLNLIENLTNENHAFVLTRKEVNVFAFLDVNDEKKGQSFLAEFERTAAVFREATFVWLDWAENKQRAMNLGLFFCEERPCVVLGHGHSELKGQEQGPIALARSFDNYIKMPDRFPKNFEGMHNFMSRALLKKKGDFEEGHLASEEAFENYKAFYSKFSMKMLSHRHFMREVLENENDYFIFLVKSFEKNDIENLEKKIWILKNFFQKTENMFPVFFIFDLNTENEKMEFALERNNVLIFTKETKQKSKNPVICRNFCQALDLILAYLKNKKVRLNKRIEFSDEERDFGINYQSVFEGNFEDKKFEFEKTKSINTQIS